MSHSNNENNTAAVDRPTVKVKPDHILKKPPAESKSSSTAIRESDLRRIRILTGSGGRKMAVRDGEPAAPCGPAAAGSCTATAAAGQPATSGNTSPVLGYRIPVTFIIDSV